MKAPILVFTYNRPEHTKNLLSSLSRCKGAETHDLYIFSDGPRNEAAKDMVDAVRAYISKFEKKNVFKSVTVLEEEKNKGLANSIIGGVSKLISQYGTCIVLEDDLYVSDDFIAYMQAGLDYYEKDKNVGAISGFSFPLKCKKDERGGVYKSRTGNSWGWATWKYVWEQVDWRMSDYNSFKADNRSRKRFDAQQSGISEMLDRQMRGELDSWAVRWDYFFFKKGLWTIYPYSSKVINNGFDGSGTHCKNRKTLPIQEVSGMPYEFCALDDCKNLTKQTSGNSMIKEIKYCLKKLLGR